MIVGPTMNEPSNPYRLRISDGASFLSNVERRARFKGTLDQRIPIERESDSARGCGARMIHGQQIEDAGRVVPQQPDRAEISLK